MDAQFCSADGDANIILGTKEQAVAVKIKGEHPIYLILDKSFLAGHVPNETNISFVQQLLAQRGPNLNRPGQNR